MPDSGWLANLNGDFIMNELYERQKDGPRERRAGQERDEPSDALVEKCVEQAERMADNRPASALECQFKTLGDELACLNALVDKLHKQLEPVMTTEKRENKLDEKARKALPESASPLTRGLESATGIVSQIAHKVNYILSRVEL